MSVDLGRAVRIRHDAGAQLILRRSALEVPLEVNGSGVLVVTGAITATSFTGSGASLTALNATALTTGTVPDGRLSANVALLTGTQTFSGAKTFSATTLTLSGANAVISLSSATGAKTITTGGTTNLALSPGGKVLVNSNLDVTGAIYGQIANFSTRVVDIAGPLAFAVEQELDEVTSGYGSTRRVRYLRLPTGSGTWDVGSGNTLTLSGALTVTGNVLLAADNTYDIGATASGRPRDVHVARDVLVGGNVNAGTVIGSQFSASRYINVVGTAGITTVEAMTLDGTNNTRVAIFANNTTSKAGIDVSQSSGVYDGLSLFVEGVEGWRVTRSKHFLAGTDNTYDIGASASGRPRDLFVARYLRAGTAVLVGVAADRQGFDVQGRNQNGFSIQTADGSTNAAYFSAATNAALTSPGNVAIVSGTDGVILAHGTTTRFFVDATGMGFFGATPVARPTGVAVTAAGIHAALVSLGLITA